MVDTTTEPIDSPQPRFECDIWVAARTFREFAASYKREANPHVRALAPFGAQRNADRAALCEQVANTLERLLTLLDDPAVLLSIPRPARMEISEMLHGNTAPPGS